MKFNKCSVAAAALTLALGITHHAFAKVSADEANKLGNSLTPLGGDKTANSDGSIPQWEGGITAVPAGFKKGDFHPDPFPNDKVMFEITGENYTDYAQNLSPGQMALFKMYGDTFKMPIYPTRRSASNPKNVYDATLVNATSAELLDGGNGIKGAAVGIPFPIPQNGLEAIWNHLLRFRGEAVERFGGQAAVTAGGDYTVIGFDEQFTIKYSQADATPQELLKNNILFMFKQKITKPARLAGTALLVHETVDQVKQPRKAWTYNTGQRRVRLAPNIAYDTPGTAADGLRTTDDFDMFNGSPNRYNWELKGKKEMYVAYNNYKLHSNKVKYKDILQAHHINPDLARYEKHRVWVVEATLKEGFRHVYKKRVFFIDEDSWQVQVADMYDNRDELYRVAVAHGINYYEVPTHWTTLEVFHDLNSRRYLAMGLDNEERMYNFDVTFNDREFSPQALRREGLR